jgi:hypothetical protein
MAAVEVLPMSDVAVPEAEGSSPVSLETVTVQSISGKVLATVSPVPPSIGELKLAIAERTSIPPALQKLIELEGTHIYEDKETLEDDKSMQLIMVTDESAMFTWQVAENPDCNSFQLEGTSTLTCPSLQSDYCNVLTKEPIRSGVHYFEFVMHHIGDEQWCGLVQDTNMAGRRTSGRFLKGWFYYAGRMGSRSGSLRDGKGALHAEGRAVTEFKKLKSEGDTIGMLVDLNVGAVAFDLNGLLQGACAVPTDKPLYVLTHLDTTRDKVELRKPSLMDAPPANPEALTGELLKIKDGEKLSYYGGRFEDSDDEASEADD